jgi:hypothetical protein
LQNYPQIFGALYENEVLSSELKFDKLLRSIMELLYGVFDGENLFGICGCIKESRIKTKHIPR